MPAVVLLLNYIAEDPTKRLKLAGIRRYAAAAQWTVVPVERGRSKSADIPALLAEYAPVGCICDYDADPMDVSPALFGDVPVVFANRHDGRFDSSAGRVCGDTEAVAAMAFRELSAGKPESYAVVGNPWFRTWSSIRVRKFVSLAAEAKRPCRVFPTRRDETLKEFEERLRPWAAALPRHTAIYAVNDTIARRVADAALDDGLRIPQDLTLLGTDNDPAFCETARPSLSSIQIDFERMGYLAAKMLGERMAIVHKSSIANCSQIANGKSGRNLHLSLVDNCEHLPIVNNPITIGPLLTMRRESTGGRGRSEPHVLEAVEIIRREACDGLTVAALAERLPGSRRLLDLRFREAMGHSVFDEILQVRLERVFDLLRRPEVPIGAVADFSGFGTPPKNSLVKTIACAPDAVIESFASHGMESLADALWCGRKTNEKVIGVNYWGLKSGVRMWTVECCVFEVYAPSACKTLRKSST